MFTVQTYFLIAQHVMLELINLNYFLVKSEIGLDFVMFFFFLKKSIHY